MSGELTDDRPERKEARKAGGAIAVGGSRVTGVCYSDGATGVRSIARKPDEFREGRRDVIPYEMPPLPVRAMAVITVAREGGPISFMARKGIKIKDLARELGVSSRVLVERCRAEGVSVQNSITRLKIEQERLVRGWYLRAEDAKEPPVA